MEKPVPLRGRGPIPRYFCLSFTIQRILVTHPPKPETIDKQFLRMKAQVMRNDGASYPEIANLLGISVGATWNLLNRRPSE